MIGTTTASGDNATDSDNIMLTLLATQSLPQVDPLRVNSLVISDTGTISTILTSTLRNNSNPSVEVTGYLAVFEDRADAQLPEAGTADIVATAAVSFSRVHWLD